jgi:5,10-methylenetetrahydromethanopterin reductase
VTSSPTPSGGNHAGVIGDHDAAVPIEQQAVKRQLWCLLRPHSGSGIARVGQLVEQAGWDGIFIPDSQNVNVDALVSMAVIAHSTSELKVSTGVTNPASRHPAVLAGAVATINEMAPGRVHLGIGRGDSALAHLGMAPVSARELAHYVSCVRKYLHSEAVPFEAIARYQGTWVKSLDPTSAGHVPSVSQLCWLRDELVVPTVWVAASGGQTIRIAASQSDGVLLAVGADPERLAWAIGQARRGGAARVGAFVNVVAHPEVAVARRLARAMVAVFARFSAMGATVSGPIEDGGRRELETLSAAYDMRDHGSGVSGQGSLLSDEFVDRFAVVGTPDDVYERLEVLCGLGLDTLCVVGAASTVDAQAAADARALFVRNVLPALRDRRT